MSDEEKVALLKFSSGNIKLLEELAHDAFQNKGGRVWREIQFLLFDLNLALMSDGFAVGTARSETEWAMRNAIERVEQQYQTQEEIPQDLHDPEEFLVWLKKRIADHRVNHNPLFKIFDNDDLSEEELRYFLANYRVNMQRFHLHVAAFSLIVPFEMREELYHNLHDEFGQGDFSKAHPNLFEPLMNHFGGARDEDVNAETCYLLNTKINLCWFADGLLHGLGGMGGLELSIPLQQRRVLAHLRRRGLSEELVEFFVVHCELDEEHGDGWFAAGMPHMRTREDFQRVFNGAMRMLEARATVYDGVLQGILNFRNAKQEEIAA
ncbi:iron-containing redox enzyme family protein [Massilia sp. erpn]|nr:iron-containing redox enzyme family protein [Massilia sp. erpn]